MRKSLSLFVLTSLVGLFTPSAFADSRDDARRHFAEGLAAAARSDYQVAANEFLAAYAAIPHQVTAFNIARAYDDLQDIESALFWYRRFQEMDPANAHDAQVRIDALEARRAPAPTEAPAVDLSALSLEERLHALERERNALLEELGREPVPDAEGDGQAEDLVQIPATPIEQASDTPPEAEPDARAEPAESAPPAKRSFFAQAESSSGTDPYESVIVSASRYDQDPLDSPQSVSVLSKEDIRMSGAVTIEDALRRVVGVDVMAMSTGAPWVGVRGFSSEMNNKVLWLIDGRPAMLNFLGTAMPFTLQVTLEEVERIEIIRGPGSAIYGANAMTGVINIITTRPGEGAKFETHNDVGWGGYYRSSNLASGKVGNLGYRFSAMYQQENRFQRELESIPENGPYKTFTSSPADYNIGDRRVQLGGRFDTTFAQRGWASLSGAWTSGLEEYYSKAALGNFGLQGGFGNVRADLGYGPIHMMAYWIREAGRTAAWLGSEGSLRDATAQVLDDIASVQLEGNGTVMSGPVAHRFLVGARYQFRQYRAGQIGAGYETPHIEHHGALYAQYQLAWEWLQFTASFRMDSHPLIPLKETLAPRAALVFRVAPKTSLRMSGGSAYRTLNGLESYVNLQLGTVADGYFVGFVGAGMGDRYYLGPERVITAELGVRDESSNIHQIDAVVYYNRMTQLIDIGSVTPTLTGFREDGTGYQYGEARWVNSPTLYESVGGEIDAKFFPIDGLDVYANLALQGMFVKPESGKSYKDTSNAVVHANVGVLYRSPFRLDFTAAASYVSGQKFLVPGFDSTGSVETTLKPIPGRVLASLRVAAHPILKPDLELALTLWNPVGFAGGFQENPDGQFVGPRLFGSVGLKF